MNLKDKWKNLKAEVIPQKAILFVKKRQQNSSQNPFLKAIQDKMPAFMQALTEDSVVKEMQEKGYFAQEVQYNPETVSIITSAPTQEEEEAAGTGGDSAGMVSMMSSTTLSFELIFEALSLMGEEDFVKKAAEGILSLMMESETRKVAFYYAGSLFRGELQNVNIQYTMFDSHGNPIWAVVSVSIIETDEAEDEQEEIQQAGTKEKPALYNYDSLEKEYENFRNPVVIIKINQKDISENKSNLSVSDIEVDLTSGYEASLAIFSIYNSFDKENACFRTEDIKKYIFLGSSVSISTGYGNVAKNIFRGFISKVNFLCEEGETPQVQVTCMDVKGIMMSGSYAKQLSAAAFGEAVEEIFQKPVYQKMKSQEIFTNISISATPDKKETSKGQKETDRTIEMVNESDYEFVVRAAKKFNYEFFVDSGIILFRKAKSVDSVIMSLQLGKGLKRFDVGYDITGLVESIQVRGMDTGKMKLIQSKQKYNEKISMGNKAKQLLKKSEKIYIDPTAKSQQDAQYRGEFLMEDMSYRFGTLDCECTGMPELRPGNFLQISALGAPADNRFYITNVKHIIDSESGYRTKITAKAASMQ